MSESTEPRDAPRSADAATEPRSAASSLFDLRSVIALLFGVYGVMLTVMGAIEDDPAQLAKADGLNLNLWTGIGMLVFAALMAAWQRLRPT